MALVGNDYVERVDWNVHLLRVFIDGLIADVKNRIATEQIDRPALNGRDVNEGVTLFGIEKIGIRKHRRIELLALVKVFAMKTLAINLVDLIELQSGFWFE